MMLATPETPRTAPACWWARLSGFTDGTLSTAIETSAIWFWTARTIPPNRRVVGCSPYSILVLATGLMRSSAR